jgi:FSR family fosmidomycin resistance protein-like MFS transporter
MNKKTIYWLSLSHAFTDIYAGFLTPLMPFIAMKIGFSLAIATIITTVSQAIASTIQPLLGYFADKSVKRVFIFWGLILASISNPIAANSNNVFTLFFFVVLGLLGGSMFHPQALGFIPKFSDKNAVYNMSLFVMCGTVGFAIGPLISSFVVSFFGYKELLLLPIFGIILALLMFKFVPKITETNPAKKDFISAIKEICSNKIMIILLTVGMMKTLIQSSCSIMIPFLWKDLGYSTIYIGFGMFLFLFAGGIGSYISHWFEKKYGAKFVFYASMVITFPLMIIYSLTYKNFQTFSLVIFVIIGFLTAFAQPITLLMAQKLLPQFKSITSGIINGFTWGFVAFLLIGLGIVAEKIGIMEILTILSAFPALASILVKYLPNKIEN